MDPELHTPALALPDISFGEKLRELRELCLSKPSSALRVNEVRRSPNPDEMIELGQILVIGKSTKLDWDMKELGITSIGEMGRYYAAQGVDPQVVLDAHFSHLRSLVQFSEVFESDQFIQLDVTPPEKLAESIDKAKLVVSLGGDDHFKSVASLVTDQIIVGVNSDPQRSVGALLQFFAEDFRKSLPGILNGNFLIEEWAQLEVKINESDARRAVSEIFIAERNAKYGSRSTITYRGQEFTSKGSGLLIATGAGSTGWFRSASRYCFPEGYVWPRTSPAAVILEREPYGDIAENRFLCRELLADEELTIRSLHNHSAVVSTDSIFDFEFPRGATARVKLADQRLKVLGLG
jgi:hypothetical protein